MANQEIKIIVATNLKNYLGKDGEMMWRSKADFSHFKAMTMGGLLIVGSTTFEKDLKGRELPGRKTYVVGSKYHTLYEALKSAMHRAAYSYETIWVIGGASIYKQLMPLVSEIHMSVINDDQVGDTKFEVPADFRGKVITYEYDTDVDYTIPESNICPATNQFCDDECCTPGGECNLKPSRDVICGNEF